MAVWPNAIYRFSAVPIKLPMAFFTELEQKIYSSYGNTKDPKQPKQSWERRMELEESNFLTSDYTTKLQSSKQYGTGTKTEIRSMEQDRNPKNKPTHLRSIIYDQGGKTTQWWKDGLFNKWCWGNWAAQVKKWKQIIPELHTQNKLKTD